MKKFKVIIDTDPGVDDTTALSFILNDPVFDVKLLTVSPGNIDIDMATRNACHILDIYQKNIPVVKGYKNRLGENNEQAYFLHGVEGMGNYIPPKSTTHKPEKKDCADAMYEILKTYPKEITLLVLGPHTNVANLLIKYPDSKDLIKQIVMMGGAPDGIKINKNYRSFNIRTDAIAFEHTATSGIPVTLCPSLIGRDVTYFSENQVEEIKNTNIVGKFIAQTFETYWEPNYPEKIISTCDLTAVYSFIYPRLYKTKKAFIEVDTKEYIGKLIPTYSNKGNFKIVKDVNRKKFHKILFKKLKELDKLEITNKTFLKNMKNAD